MKEEKNIELKMNPVGPFFSDDDEAFFFQWLGKIKCVKRYEGRLHTLYIEVDPKLVGEEELREIIALFLRYDVDMKQLAIFDRPEFSEWLKNWYELIFGNKKTNQKKEETKEYLRHIAENRE